MQTTFGDVYTCTLPNVRHTDALRIRTSDFWKKWRRQPLHRRLVIQILVISAHVPTNLDDNISLDDDIAKFKAMDGITKHAETILASTITLRDSSSRDRLLTLRKMAATWNVARYYEVNDK